MKTVTFVLLVLALTLGAAYVVQQKRFSDRLHRVQGDAFTYSNQWLEARSRLDERDKVIGTLETNLNQRGDQLALISNDLVKANGDLTQTRTDLAKAQSEIKTVRSDFEKQTSRITELEGEKDVLTKKLEDLTGSINSLETQITDTKRKLANAEGNRDFLLKELKRLQDEKATLVAQFNNIATLRDQLAKLREDAAISQRISWTKKGVYQRREMKGAEALIVPAEPAATPASRLDVEVEQSGQVRVLSTTNSPPATNSASPPK